MKYVSALDTAGALGWGFSEWTAFVLDPIRRMRPSRTEAGGGKPLMLPCRLVVTLEAIGEGGDNEERYIVHEVLESSIADAKEWDAARRLGEPWAHADEFGKLFDGILGIDYASGEGPKK